MATPMLAASEAAAHAITDDHIKRVETLVPLIRELASQAETERRVPDRVIDAAIAIDLFAAMVPGRWGGQGLGLKALCETGRALARADASIGWTLAFLIEHNWMACRLPMEAQERVYGDRNFILASAPLVAAGTAERIDEGWLVSGTWRYATGVSNADWTFVTSRAEENGEKIPYTFLVPLSDVQVHDNWHVSGMCATASHSVSAEKMFVPAHMCIETELFHSADMHGGTDHPEAVYHYPMHPSLNNMMASVFVGMAERVVELYEERLPTSLPFGLARRERAPSRMRWGAERERIRAARLLYEDILGRTIAKCEARERYEQSDMGDLQIATVTVAHMCHEAVTNLCKGVGSSAYTLDQPIQRFKRDIDVLINHAGQDWDVVAERATRWMLGFGLGPHDPHPPRKTPRLA